MSEPKKAEHQPESARLHLNDQTQRAIMVGMFGAAAMCVCVGVAQAMTHSSFKQFPLEMWSDIGEAGRFAAKLVAVSAPLLIIMAAIPRVAESVMSRRSAPGRPDAVWRKLFRCHDR